jgi:hypothetical protein
MMKKNELGVKLVEQLLARGLTEKELELFVESNFVADRVAEALTETIAYLCVMVSNQRNESEQRETIHAHDVLSVIDRAGINALYRYQCAHADYNRQIRRQNRLTLVA